MNTRSIQVQIFIALLLGAMCGTALIARYQGEKLDITEH